VLDDVSQLIRQVSGHMTVAARSNLNDIPIYSDAVNAFQESSNYVIDKVHSIKQTAKSTKSQMCILL